MYENFDSLKEKGPIEMIKLRVICLLDRSLTSRLDYSLLSVLVNQWFVDNLITVFLGFSLNQKDKLCSASNARHLGIAKETIKKNKQRMYGKELFMK